MSDRRLLDPIPERVIAAQRRAADPAGSVWVEANAGSGKTHVLTERVLRLLLSGVPPESILCLTYTKAAAAEMRKRVSGSLARWALLPDAELADVLAKLQGRPPAPDERLRARTLFAHALDTPGGLKINTIHAFCEAVLHRFPLEAQVPIDFSVIEDEERADLILAARESVLAGGLRGDPHVAEAVAVLFGALSDDAIAKAIDEALGQGRKLRTVLADRVGAKARLRRLVRQPQGETAESLSAEIAGGTRLTPAVVSAVQALTPGEPGGSRFEDRLLDLDFARLDPDLLTGIFLNAEGMVRKSLLKKKAADADPGLADLIAAEAARLADLAARLTRARLVERSEALIDVLGAIIDRYEAEKRARSRLDFDDLIARVGKLFTTPGLADWVRYKLDAGITHILVDESQDTNPEQWQVVDAIAEEFFAGEGAIARPRTIFAVGDQKQSIYSFQGADPALFGEAGRKYGRRAADALREFANQPLQISFRTLENILSAVDLVFDDPLLRDAVLAPPDRPVHHESARADAGGTVTLWPPIQDEADDPDDSAWPTAAPEIERSAARRVADRIAGEVSGWVAAQRALGPRGRAITADDVLILVQSRGTLFREIIRALVRHGLPTPGADRLAVTSHIGVLDLLALADVLLNPADDLQLAALLRSPLFDVSEDDLYAIAQPRPRGQTLWQALAATSLPPAVAAFAKLSAWRDRLDFERPFEFFAHVLYREQGLKRFHARLGAEVDDVFSEFLDLALAHEQTAQPSLQGFVAAMRAKNISIKRELAETGNGVRVMTVHGAKGLEAPVVILADAASKPDPTQTARPVYVVPEAPGPLLIHAGAKADHVPETMDLRIADQRRLEAEYWRKLYVGMTRAEDELYLTGALTKTGKLDGTWYQAVADRLAGLCEVEAGADGAARALVYPAVRPAPRPVATAGQAPAAPGPVPLDAVAVPPPETVPVLTPSSAGAAADRRGMFDTALDRTQDADAARRAGLALHAMLQHLPRLPETVWDQVLERALPQLLPEAPESHAGLARTALSILRRPEFAPLFGPDSRAEVPFLVTVLRDGKPVRLAGRIDRLVVTEKNLFVLDYKSDAAIPADPANMPSSYATQLALYALAAGQLFPGREVKAAILWTALESLMELPPAQLAAAAAAFTLR